MSRGTLRCKTGFKESNHTLDVFKVMSQCPVDGQSAGFQLCFGGFGVGFSIEYSTEEEASMPILLAR